MEFTKEQLEGFKKDPLMNFFANLLGTSMEEIVNEAEKEKSHIKEEMPEAPAEPEIDEDEPENVLVGSFIGDGEYLYFSGKSGQFFTVFDGEVEEYDSFDSVLTSISVDLEEKAEEIFGEDWLEEFEE